jgi:hypothetical protein
VGHYRVHIPPDDAEAGLVPGAMGEGEEDDDDDEFPASIIIPIVEVPISPPGSDADRGVAPNTEDSDSDKEDKEDEEPSDEEEDEGDAATANLSDLGPEDGAGGLPAEVKEGYAPL